MIGLTLGSYFARHFLRYTLMIFSLFFFLILAVDLVELTRRAPDDAENATFQIFQIALFRAPDFAKSVLPFTVLFGAAVSLILLNRRLELVVARASGVSVWQFLVPYALVAILLGLGASLVYEPIALSALKASRAAEAGLFGRVRGNFSNKSRNFWLRVPLENGDAIIRAAIAEDGGRKLSAVSVYRFDLKGVSIDRIDAKNARFKSLSEKRAVYELSDTIVTASGKAGIAKQNFKLAVKVSADELQDSALTADSLPFWELDKQAERARAAGRNDQHFLTRKQALLSQPLLYIAMVLLAACVSLTFTRFGQSGTRILGGVLAGFVLYVVSVIVLTFGSNGLVSPVMAAWAPSIVATLIGTTILLYQEDG